MASRSSSPKGARYYVLWGVLLWLFVTALILLGGGNSKFIYIDF